MPANDYVRARIDPTIKREAAAVLAGMGLTVSDACRMMLTKIAREKCLPFGAEIPNEETRQALEAVQKRCEKSLAAWLRHGQAETGH